MFLLFLFFSHHYKDATFETEKCSTKKLKQDSRGREYPFRLIKELEKDNEREDISKIKTIRLRKKSD